MLKPTLIRLPIDLRWRTSLAANEKNASEQKRLTKALEPYLGTEVCR